VNVAAVNVAAVAAAAAAAAAVVATIMHSTANPQAAQGGLKVMHVGRAGLFTLAACHGHYVTLCHQLLYLILNSCSSIMLLCGT
jgi:hypothetical protein